MELIDDGEEHPSGWLSHHVRCMAGVSVATVDRAMRSLREGGCLVVVNRGRRTYWRKA